MNDERLGALPDLFCRKDGSRVTDPASWKERREEILADAVRLEYGGMPPLPDKMRVERLCRTTYKIFCTHGEREVSFCFEVYKPQGNGRKTPVVVTGDAMYHDACNDRVIAEANRRGFAVVRFNRTEVASDDPNRYRESGVFRLYPQAEFSVISAWAWGYHRVVDALAQTDFADMKHIAITGHSRGGKAVLLAGATDERIRYVNPNGSGTHGCGCYRYVQHNDCPLYEDEHSEPLSYLFEAAPHWMGAGMRAYIGRETELPHDAHFIKALIAPRPYLETNGYGDIWANPKGSYVTFLAAKPAWELYGAGENCRTFYRNGVHGHTWEDFSALFDFMDADLNGATLPESLTREPFENQI